MLFSRIKGKRSLFPASFLIAYAVMGNASPGRSQSLIGAENCNNEGGGANVNASVTTNPPYLYVLRNSIRATFFPELISRRIFPQSSPRRFLAGRISTINGPQESVLVAGTYFFGGIRPDGAIEGGIGALNGRTVCNPPPNPGGVAGGGDGGGGGSGGGGTPPNPCAGIPSYLCQASLISPNSIASQGTLGFDQSGQASQLAPDPSNLEVATGKWQGQSWQG
jgi:hypothetical protein